MRDTQKHAYLYPFLLTGIATFLLCFGSYAQSSPSLLLKKGFLQPEKNIQDKKLTPIPIEHLIDNHYYRIVQFDHVLLDDEKKVLEAHGVQLLEYIPHFAYVASIPVQFDLHKLIELGGRSMLDYNSSIRTSTNIGDRPFPEHAMFGERVAITFKAHKDLEATKVISDLIKIERATQGNTKKIFA